MEKCFYDRAKELADNCNSVKNNNVYETLSEEYGITKRTAGDRFRSYFGKCVSEYISEAHTPTKEEVRNALIVCESTDEVMKMLNTNSYWFKGLYDKYFNVSTFIKAKAKILNEKDEVAYNPTIEDNLSLFLSQKLGDGSFETYNNRRCLKIEHGSKQLDYLKFKISLFCKAFPQLEGFGKIRKRVSTDNYISYSWRTNNMNSKAMIQAIETSKVDAVHKLTPLGWLLWFLDDGTLYQDENSHCIIISMSDEKLKDEAIKELETYGMNFKKSKNGIIVSDYINIVKFLNCFIKPFNHIIPECMKYKCVIKI